MSNDPFNEAGFIAFKKNFEDRQARKSLDNKFNSSAVDVLSTRTNSVKSQIPPDLAGILPTSSSAKMNQAFVVWKDGEVGTIAVDTPFGFKPL